MTIREIYKFYRKLNGRDFWGRSMRRIFDFAIPQTSYSQAGEDVIVDFLLQGVGVEPTYLELGTNHPRIGNNTYKFYRRGCHGVLVEADPSLIPSIRNARKRDTVLNIGVSAYDEMVKKFYVLSCPSFNTFDENAALERENSSTVKIKAAVDIQLIPINTIIERHFSRTPDFLSIDIEGLDLEVLKSLDFTKHPIPIICAETCEFSETHIKPKDRSIEEYMTAKGYFVYADTYVNTVFVNEMWFRRGGK